MAAHIVEKNNTLQALEKVNSLLSQSLQIIKKVNECEQWDFCTSAELANKAATTERLAKEISDIVFQNNNKK